jgi:hypothetical protein
MVCVWILVVGGRVIRIAITIDVQPLRTCIGRRSIRIRRNAFNGSRPFPRECPSSAFSLRGFGERNQVFEP